jgi:hypothetical protein
LPAVDAAHHMPLQRGPGFSGALADVHGVGGAGHGRILVVSKCIRSYWFGIGFRNLIPLRVSTDGAMVNGLHKIF